MGNILPEHGPLWHPLPKVQLQGMAAIEETIAWDVVIPPYQSL